MSSSLRSAACGVRRDASRLSLLSASPLTPSTRCLPSLAKRTRAAIYYDAFKASRPQGLQPMGASEGISVTEFLRPGDKIWVPGPYLTKHYGIYIGRCFGDQHGLTEHAVVHNSKVRHGVVIDSFERFCGGKQVEIEGRAVSGHEGTVVVRRALGLVGTKYDVLGFNCERMVNVAQTGEHRSQQLRNAAGLSALGLLALALVGSGDRPRYDRSMGRYRDKQGRFVSR